MIGKPFEVVDHVLASEVLDNVGEPFPVAEMGVELDECGHHRLAREIHTAGAGRQRHLVASANAHEAIAVYDKRRVGDGRSAVADDETRAFEQCQVACRLSPRGRRRHQRANGHRSSKNDPVPGHRASAACTEPGCYSRSGHLSYERNRSRI